MRGGITKTRRTQLYDGAANHSVKRSARFAHDDIDRASRIGTIIIQRKGNLSVLKRG